MSAVENPLTAEDSVLAQYADSYFEYDSAQRVTKETVNGGRQTFTYSRTENPRCPESSSSSSSSSSSPQSSSSSSTTSSGSSVEPKPDYNCWKRKIVETRPDGTERIVYGNIVGQTMLEVLKSGNDEWYDFTRFDEEARVIMTADSFALLGYDDVYNDLLHGDLVSSSSGGDEEVRFEYMKDDEGLLRLTVYDETTGRISEENHRKGQEGGTTPFRSYFYDSFPAGGIGVTKLSVERIHGIRGGWADTVYEYTFHSGTAQVAQLTTKLPAIPADQNGSGTADSRYEYFDEHGYRTWLKDERDFITAFRYDEATGALTQRIDDVDTSIVSGAPPGWTTSGGLNLVTDYEHDVQGRITQTLGPLHTVDLGGTPTPVRTAEWTVYPNAGTVGNDVVLEQQERTYDDASNIIQTIRRQRYHTADGNRTGLLQGPTGAKPHARVTYAAAWPDAVGRITAVAEYGTNGGAALVRPETVPSRSDAVLVTTAEYAAAGLPVREVDPGGSVTRLEFDDAGRPTRLIENAAPSNSSSSSGSVPPRTTSRTYTADGAVASLTAANSETGAQTTAYVYGTTLSNSDIATSTLLQAVVYPDSASGTDRVTLRYNRQGEVIRLTDQRGTVHVFDYDLLGRRVEDRVTVLGSGVDGAVRRIATTFDARGLPEDVTSYDQPEVGLGTVLNQVHWDYNGFAQPVRVAQSHSGPAVLPPKPPPPPSSSSSGSSSSHSSVSSSSSSSWSSSSSFSSSSSSGPLTPWTAYEYADGTDNSLRPTRLTYPNGREVDFHYDTMDGKAGRVTALIDRPPAESSSSTSSTPSETTLASYQYLGLQQPVLINSSEPHLQYTLVGTTGGVDPDTGDIYHGLDRFGRIKELFWLKFNTLDTSSSSSSSAVAEELVNLQYGYDRESNRTFRADLIAPDADRDEFYTYDGLKRLTNADRGTPDSSGTGIGTLTFAQEWLLDETGNWAEFRQDDTGNGTWNLDQARTANKVNEITGITETAGPAWATPEYDPAGNMTTVPQPGDPTQTYAATYDAWNRLVKLTQGNDTVQENVYDGRHYRIVKKTYDGGVLDETRHAYFSEAWQALEERTGDEPETADAERQFVWGARYIDDLILRDRDTTGSGLFNERLYAMQDANWNVVAVADEAGTVQERYGYDPYGIPEFLDADYAARGSSSYEWETLYAGYCYDSGTGLYHVRHRILHSRLGMWLQRDPFGYVNGHNLYSYAMNAPAVLVDPAGAQSEVPDPATGKPTEKCDDKCGPDVTEWFRQDIIMHSIYAAKYSNTIAITRLSKFRHHAADIMAHKWMRFGVPGVCGTGKCANTVMLAGVCIRKNQLGNMMFAFIATHFPPGGLTTAGQVDTGEEAITFAYETVGLSYSDRHPYRRNWHPELIGARRADNLAAFGVGYSLAQNPNPNVIINYKQFNMRMGQYLNSAATLRQFAPLYGSGARGKFGPNTLTFIPEGSGFNTRSCQSCCRTFSPAYTSIQAAGRLRHAGRFGKTGALEFPSLAKEQQRL